MGILQPQVDNMSSYQLIGDTLDQIEKELVKVTALKTKVKDKVRVSNKKSVMFLPEASFGLLGLSLPASCLCVCVHLSVRPSITKLVCAMTHDPLKLGSWNLDQRCKTAWLRSLLLFGTIDLDLQGQIQCQNQILPSSGFEVCLYHNSSPIQARITKFGPQVQNTLLKTPVAFGSDHH